jgi:hypothetical protein
MSQPDGLNRFTRGTTFVVMADYVDEDDDTGALSAVDISGATAVLQFRKSPTAPAVFTLTEGAGIEFSDPVGESYEGTVCRATATVSAANSALLTEGDYLVNLVIVKAGLGTVELYRETITVDPWISRS